MGPCCEAGDAVVEVAVPMSVFRMGIQPVHAALVLECAILVWALMLPRPGSLPVIIGLINGCPWH